MIPLQFFALEEDLVQLFEYLLDREGMVAIERNSEIGQTARSFSTAAELARAYSLGFDADGSSFAVLVAVWSRRVRPRPTPERVQLSRAGGGWRETVRGAGLFSFDLGGLGPRGISHSTFQVDSPSSGSDAGDLAGVRVNWAIHDRLAKAIRSYLRGEWCAGHFGDLAVGRSAYEDFTEARTAGAALSLRSWARVIARRPHAPRLTLRQLSRMEWSQADPEPPGG